MRTEFILYFVVFLALAISVKKDRQKSWKALMISYRTFLKLLPTVLTILTVVGMIMGILDEKMISKLIGKESGFAGVLAAWILGSITLMPSFVAFQLSGALLESGAGYPQVAAFIGTLMGVGILTYPIERKFFGTRFSIIRNLLFFIASVLFTVVIWRVFL